MYRKGGYIYMYKLMEKKLSSPVLKKFAISIFIIYFLFDFILYGIYYTFVRSDNHLTFRVPYLYQTKHFVIGFVIVLFLYRTLNLTDFGKKILPLFLIITVAGMFVTSLWFQSVTEEKITKFRVVNSTTYSWDEVEYVEPKIYRKIQVYRSRRTSRQPRKVYTEYYLHFTNGSVLNVWEDLDTVYELHQFVLAQGIEIADTDRELESFRQAYTSYFKDDMSKAEFILYER